MPIYRTLAACLFAALPIAACAEPGDLTFRTVADNRRPAPGGSGEDFSSFPCDPVINAHGEVAFAATMRSTDNPRGSDHGLWAEIDGELTLLMRSRQPAADIDDVLFSGVTCHTATGSGVVPSWNSAGQSAFIGHLCNPPRHRNDWPTSNTSDGVNASNNHGIFFCDRGELTLIVRKGGPVEGIDGARHHFISPPILGENGHVVFLSQMRGDTVSSDNQTGLFRWDPATGATTLLARRGDPAPGIDGAQLGRFVERTVSFQGFDEYPAIAANGDIYFLNDLAGQGVGGHTAKTLWRYRDGKLTLVGRGGDTIPGYGGPHYMAFGHPVVNERGELALWISLYGERASGARGRGNAIMTWRDGEVGVLASNGDPAAGIEGTIYDSVNMPRINARGEVAYVGRYSPTSSRQQAETALWIWRDGKAHLIVRKGDTAPGTDGMRFSNMFATFVFNNASQIAFHGGLDTSQEGVGFGNTRGIWMTDHDGKFKLIVREGDPFDIDDDPDTEDMKPVVSISMYSPPYASGGIPTSLNDQGQLAFRLGFQDGTWGIFVAEFERPAPTEPDPGPQVAVQDSVLDAPDEAFTPQATTSTPTAHVGIPWGWIGAGLGLGLIAAVVGLFAWKRRQDSRTDL